MAMHFPEEELLSLPWISIHEVPQKQKECFYWTGVTCSELGSLKRLLGSLREGQMLPQLPFPLEGE